MGNDQVSQVDRRVQVPVSLLPRLARIHVPSGSNSAFTPFQKWQRFTLGNATGMTLA